MFGERMGGSGLLSKRLSRNPFRISGGMKFPNPLPLNGMLSSTNLRHKKNLPFSCWSSTRSWRLMSGVGKSQWILTNIAPTATHSRWNQWNIGSFVALLLNKGGGMPLISCGNSLPKEGTMARGTLFP